jgi:hypothetical protein
LNTLKSNSSYADNQSMMFLTRNRKPLPAPAPSEPHHQKMDDRTRFELEQDRRARQQAARQRQQADRQRVAA